MNLEKLKKRREELGYTQKELALKLGISQQRYNFYENGKREPDNEMLLLIGSALDVDANFLLGNTDDTTHINKEKEPTPEIGSLEWLRQGLVARGVMKDGEDITAEQLEILLANIDTIASVLKQHTTQNVQ